MPPLVNKREAVRFDAEGGRRMPIASAQRTASSQVDPPLKTGITRSELRKKLSSKSCKQEGAPHPEG